MAILAAVFGVLELAKPKLVDAPAAAARGRRAGRSAPTDELQTTGSAPIVNRRALKRPQAKPARAKTTASRPRRPERDEGPARV